MSNMATVSTCDKCGLSYYDSLMPHKCAEWTKGRKEAKEQPMSDTLLEPEDQKVEVWVSHFDSRHRKGEPCNQCDRYKQPDQGIWCDDCHGYTHMPWCPAYVSADRCPQCGGLNTSRGKTRLWCNDCQRHTWTYGSYEPDKEAAKRQPAARGGGERVKVELINGIEGRCIAVNDYRTCGPKPWGGGSVAQSWTTDKNDVLRAFLTPDQKHAWLADDLEVVSVNQHQALVAERELLLEALRGVGMRLHGIQAQASSGAENTYDIASDLRGLRDEILRILNEQRSTSE